MSAIRIGFGVDVHRLDKDRDLYLGGVKIPSDFGAVGHSDADVLIHAICDAILGAANSGDIGTNFPDTDINYKDIDSKILLIECIKIIHQKGYFIGNIDSTICLQRPKIMSYIPEMKKVLADCMQIDIDLISIKATTTEKLGFVGREEGISAYATVLIKK